MDSTTTSSSSSHHLIDPRLEDHRKYMPESSRCPTCGHKIDRKLDWVGLPAGVKFDPTDQELIEHLEAKIGSESGASHPLIDEFIPTIEGDDGICYTHPERLPGVTKDGLSRHFFHRPSKAYTTGTRKRRKIQPAGPPEATAAAAAQLRSETRWHKTGKTRPVVVGGRQKGCKKILVLYTNFGKHRKPEKTNWVMHQYHLGEAEEERDGELVVSKIFYQTQPRQCSTVGEPAAAAEKNSSSRPERPAASNAVGFRGGTDEFSFAQFRSSFEEVGMGSEVQHRDGGGMHHGQEHERHYAPPVQHHASGEQCVAASSSFHVSTPTDPIATLIAAPPRLHHGAVVLREAYDAASYQEEEQQHQPRRPTSGLEEVIMGCTSRRSKGETSGGKETSEWQYPSFWPSETQDHHG